MIDSSQSALYKNNMGPTDLTIKTEGPLDTAILCLVQAVDELNQLLLENTGVRRQVKDHERRLRLIEDRLGTLATFSPD